MIYLILLCLVALIGYTVTQWFIAAKPHSIAKLLLGLVIGGLLAMAGLLLLTGKMAFAFPVFGSALLSLLRQRSLLLWIMRWLAARSLSAVDNGAHDHLAASPMDQSRALGILGLPDDASEDEILEAHRRLIRKFHPDQGGSDYLAAQINQAKAFLLKE